MCCHLSTGDLVLSDFSLNTHQRGASIQCLHLERFSGDFRGEGGAEGQKKSQCIVSVILIIDLCKLLCWMLCMEPCVAIMTALELVSCDQVWVPRGPCVLVHRPQPGESHAERLVLPLGRLSPSES